MRRPVPGAMAAAGSRRGPRLPDPADVSVKVPRNSGGPSDTSNFNDDGALERRDRNVAAKLIRKQRGDDCEPDQCDGREGHQSTR